MNAHQTFSPFRAVIVLLIAIASPLRAADLPIVPDVEWQPFSAQVWRLIEATESLGSPFSAADRSALQGVLNSSPDANSIRRVQELLDAHCLFGVTINPEMRVKVLQGPARPELVEQGWRQFLIKVQNESGTTAPLAAVSPNALSVFESGAANTSSDRAFRKRGQTVSRKAADLWLDLQTFDRQPLRPTLSGMAVEYRIVQLYSRDAGRREAKISFNVGQGTQDIGFRNDTDILFNCLPAREVALRVRDENGKPTTASFVIRDAAQRVYPSQAKRLAPDFAFHPQIYRADGEMIRMPDGVYTIEFQRGPESVLQKQTVEVSSKTKELKFQVERWIDPSKMGWWSGDHHIHAAGCAHYTNPTEGVHAPDVARHCQGEDLKIGANLTWGPCFDYQKKFFTGLDDKVSLYPYLLRYDIEVSGFGSHQSGHLCLLRLKDQMYPGGDSTKHWPTLGLNTLRWAKKQGAVVGPAHSGWGLEVHTHDLPSLEMPKFDGIGANEYIVDVTHMVPGPDGSLVPAVDFISTVDTPCVWELNIWYHTLNCGFRTRISGETDFPCIYGEKVGLGRSYVKIDGKLNYDDWCEGIRKGRNYVSDGKSHLLDFSINSIGVGENGSEVRLSQPGSVTAKAKVAARLKDQADAAMQNRPYGEKPYWDIERARISGGREVPVELLVNGKPVARQTIVADGQIRDLSFDVKIEQSSWVALRILPSSHTNPIWVTVDNQPVRPSRQSAEWCLQAVDQCWSQKEKLIAAAEQGDAKAAYDHARETYRRIVAESKAE